MPKIKKAIRAILDSQREDGGWNIYQPGASEINATVRAYSMLKMTGMDPNDPRMKKARALILEMGGIQGTDLDYVVFFEKPFRKLDRILMTAFQTYPKSCLMRE